MEATAAAMVAATVAGAVALGACSSDGQSSGGVIEQGLNQIPDEVFDIIDDGDAIDLVVGDIAALAEVSRVDEPESGRDVDELSNWFLEMSSGAERDESEVAIFLPQQYQRAYFEPDAFDDELGLDIGGLTSYIDVRSSTFAEFTVFVGDFEFDRSLGIDVGEAGSLGEGEDGEIDIDRVSSVNVIGRVLGLAQRDGAVAVSTIQDATEAWVDDSDETLADDDDYLAVARALDARGAVGAYIREADFGDLAFAPPDRIEAYAAAAVIDEPFDLVAMGMSEVDGDPATVVAYLFDDEDDASSQLDGIEELWTDTELVSNPREFIDDLYEFVSVEQDGAVVAVTVTSSDGRDTTAVLELLIRADLQFFYA